MERWALKRYVRKVSRTDYIRALEEFITAFEAAFDCKAQVELKVYDRPMFRPTRLDRDFPPIDTPVKRLPMAKMLTAEDWAENHVFECIIKADDHKGSYSSVFASIQAGRRYAKQITFYLQGTGADEHVSEVRKASEANSNLACGNGKEAWRSFHN